MNSKIYDNYKIGRKELFLAIKECNVEECKTLFEKHKDLAHTQCEIETNTGQIHYFPLWYLISLETEEEHNNTEKFDIIDVILKNTTDIEWAYDSLYFSLEYLIIKRYPITNVTVTMIQKSLEHIFMLFEKTSSEAIKYKLCYNLYKFNLQCRQTNEQETSLYHIVKNAIEKH